MASVYCALMAMYCCSRGVYCLERAAEWEGTLGLPSDFDFDLHLLGVTDEEGFVASDAGDLDSLFLAEVPLELVARGEHLELGRGGGFFEQ